MTSFKLCVNKNESFRKELAIAVVEESQPGYKSDGYYADPTKGIVYVNKPKDISVFPVKEFFADEDFYINLGDWHTALDSCEISLSSILEDYAKAVNIEAETRYSCGLLKDYLWDLQEEAIDWAMNEDRYKQKVSVAADIVKQNAINFALSQIKEVIEGEN